MNCRKGAAALFSILAAMPGAFAQSPTPGADTAASPAKPDQAAPKPPPPVARDAAADGDARRCLEFPTNLQVITCAERYRAHLHKA